jgi:hypothetical protein
VDSNTGTINTKGSSRRLAAAELMGRVRHLGKQARLTGNITRDATPSAHSCEPRTRIQLSGLSKEALVALLPWAAG